jgi:hypothetical protein
MRCSRPPSPRGIGRGGHPLAREMMPVPKSKDASERTLDSEVKCCLVIAVASLPQGVRALPVGPSPQSPAAGRELS